MRSMLERGGAGFPPQESDAGGGYAGGLGMCSPLGGGGAAASLLPSVDEKRDSGGGGIRSCLVRSSSGPCP